MVRVKALELLENAEYCQRLTMDGLYRLLLKAGFPHEESHKVASEHGMQRLNAGQTL